jgi:hypothetical protein
MTMPGRKYNATASSGYRYSINGQEKESELNENITTALYWEYDSRIVRRWNVDPVLKVSESPYLCFNGNPIAVSDILGNEGKPVNKIKNLVLPAAESSSNPPSGTTNWKPLNTGGLIGLGTKNNIFKLTPPFKVNVTRLGRIFERAVLSSLGATKNTASFTSQGGRTVIPDATFDGGVKLIDATNINNTSRLRFKNSVFQEVKFKSNIGEPDPWNPGQINGMIDILSEQKGAEVVTEFWRANIPRPDLKASDYGAATLLLITPANTVIDQSIITHAIEKRVNLLHRTVEQSTSNENNIRVSFGTSILNIVTPLPSTGLAPIPTGVLISAFKKSGSEATLDWIFTK